jgi:hypothetical protein
MLTGRIAAGVSLMVVVCAHATPAGVAFDKLFRADLTGGQVRPTPRASAAKAFASLALNDTQTLLSLVLRFEGLTAPATSVHVHGPSSTETTGPIVFTLACPAATEGSCLMASQPLTPTQVTGLRTAKWYVDVHTSAFSGGEIRGWIIPDAPFAATLSGTAVVPPVASGASGTIKVSVGAANTMLAAWIGVQGLTNADQGQHVHAPAVPGANGPIAVDLPISGSTAFEVGRIVQVNAAEGVLVRTRPAYFDVHTTAFPAGELRGDLRKKTARVVDFDGDGTGEIAVRRGFTDWYTLNVVTGQVTRQSLGGGADFPTPGDFDGDGSVDAVSWGVPPLQVVGKFVGRLSATSFPEVSSYNHFVQSLGTTGDDARISADYDGDGITDFAVFRPGTGAGQQSVFFIVNSVDGVLRAKDFGLDVDVPVIGNYGGDRKDDVAVYRTTTGTYFVSDGASSFRAQPWGTFATDVVVPGDYDGDGITDFAIWRGRIDGTSGIWFILESTTQTLRAQQWGIGSTAGVDRPVPADYDGDGKTDLAVVRNADGVLTWYILRSSDGLMYATVFGFSTDIPVATYLIR